MAARSPGSCATRWSARCGENFVVGAEVRGLRPAAGWSSGTPCATPPGPTLTVLGLAAGADRRRGDHRDAVQPAGHGQAHPGGREQGRHPGDPGHPAGLDRSWSLRIWWSTCSAALTLVARCGRRRGGEPAMKTLRRAWRVPSARSALVVLAAIAVRRRLRRLARPAGPAAAEPARDPAGPERRALVRHRLPRPRRAQPAARRHPAVGLRRARGGRRRHAARRPGRARLGMAGPGLRLDRRCGSSTP